MWPHRARARLSTLPSRPKTWSRRGSAGTGSLPTLNGAGRRSGTLKRGGNSLHWVGGNEEVLAFAAFVEERDNGVDDRDATTLGDLYADEFDALADKAALGPLASDLDEARDLVSATPAGKRILRLINAARGKVSITLAGESFLEQATLSLGTKRLYRGVYRYCKDHLPHPQQVKRSGKRESSFSASRGTRRRQRWGTTAPLSALCGIIWAST